MKELLKSIPMSPQEEMNSLLYAVKGEISESISKAMQLASLLESYRLHNLSTELRDKIIVLLKEFERNISNVLGNDSVNEDSKPSESEEAEQEEPEQKESETKICPECDTEVPGDADVCPECEYDFTSENEEDA